MNIKVRQTAETVARTLNVEVVMSASIKKNNDKSESEKEIELVSLTYTLFQCKNDIKKYKNMGLKEGRKFKKREEI